MKQLIYPAVFVSLLLVTAPASAAVMKLPCSILVAKGTPASQLPALARAAEETARKNALASLKMSPGTPDTAVVDSELESEGGCLVYSFDIAIPGRTGIEEVWVDAGNGRVLWTQHETEKKEAAEQATKKRMNKQ